MRNIFNTTLLERTSSLFSCDSIIEMQSKIKSDNVIYVTDENTSYLTPDKERTIIIKSGEGNKTIDTVISILKKAVELNLDRNSTFIALGGGVVCDITSLSSSLYMRGCHLTLCPTTLLSMVDATLGGKTGIDFMDGKNLIGTFYPAEKVYITPDVLSTLNDHEYISGLGEVVKHAFLSKDESLYKLMYDNVEDILNRDKETLYKLIELSLNVKKDFVEKDPREENGVRKALNFGHTFSHALESISNFSVPHGEGVVWGMKKALNAGLFLGITTNETYLWAIDLMSKYPFNTKLKVKREDGMKYLEYVKKDKKKNGKKVEFVLLSSPGEVVLRELTDEQIMSVVI